MQKACETYFYEIQCLASSNSVIYLWPDDGLVIEAETCCHLVTLNEINIHNIVVFWLVNLYSLLVYIEHNGDGSPKDRIYINLLNTELTLILLMWRIGWAPNSIPVYSYIQQGATLHSLFISGNYSTCFGWYFHPSSGAYTTVSTASGICHTLTAICRYRGRVGTGLSVLWVA